MFQLVLLSNQKHIDVGNLSLSAELMGLPKDIPISIRQTCLMGGKQTGSRLITLTVGDSVVRIVPDTRHGRFWMSLGKMWLEKTFDLVGILLLRKWFTRALFIKKRLAASVGWDGFNEMIVRCGLSMGRASRPRRR